jgi:hypothetical protein
MPAAWDPSRDATRPPRQRRALLARGSLALVAVLAAALGGCTLGREPQARSAPAPVIAPSAQAATGDIPQVVRKVEPSVVTVAHDQGTGSGVVWSKDGVVVTNNHVVRVEDQVVERVEVAFFDGRRVPGTVRATDPSTDLAVVQVDRKDLKPATFQRALPQVGELAIAIGSPLGFETPSPPASSPASTVGSPARLSRASARWSTSSRPTPRSPLATPAARWSTAAARSSASATPTSHPRRARSPSGSPSPPPPPSTWSPTSSAPAAPPTPSSASSQSR